MSNLTLPGLIANPMPPFSPVSDGALITIPAFVHSLSGFREWYASDDFPEEGRIEYLGGEITIDMGHERLSSHVALKGELARALIGLAEELNVGEFFTDGCRVVNVAADLSCEPDGCYLTWASVAAGRVQLHKSADGADVTEIVGVPELVLEIVSPSSVHKDTTRLPTLLHRAGIPEFWLIDARRENMAFEIFHHTPHGYVPVIPQDGWRQSAVFSRQVRVDRALNPIGIWKYRLSTRPLDAVA
jgi:Uma2 family endonuclease